MFPVRSMASASPQPEECRCLYSAYTLTTVKLSAFGLLLLYRVIFLKFSRLTNVTTGFIHFRNSICVLFICLPCFRESIPIMWFTFTARVHTYWWSTLNGSYNDRKHNFFQGLRYPPDLPYIHSLMKTINSKSKTRIWEVWQHPLHWYDSLQYFQILMKLSH